MNEGKVIPFEDDDHDHHSSSRDDSSSINATVVLLAPAKNRNSGGGFLKTSLSTDVTHTVQSPPSEMKNSYYEDFYKNNPSLKKVVPESLWES